MREATAHVALILNRYRAPDRVELIRHGRERTGSYVDTFGGWEWTIGGNSYRTDTMGEGLWIWSEGRREWRQTLGTGQFSLSSDRAKARRQIRQRFRHTDGG